MLVPFLKISKIKSKCLTLFNEPFPNLFCILDINHKYTLKRCTVMAKLLYMKEMVPQNLSSKTYEIYICSGIRLKFLLMVCFKV